VKITQEPGSSPDRVIVNVEVEEKSTGDFSVSGGYSTSDGFLAEVSVSERNLLGRGLLAKASVQYGQYARGYTLSFVEPYLLGYRVALGLDFYQRQQLANSYISYDSKTLGVSPRLGFLLREDLSLQVRYSISSQKISLPFQYRNCYNLPGTIPDGFLPIPDCFLDGESSVPVKAELAQGSILTSSAGYTLSYNTLDNNKDPTSGILATLGQDFAGIGGDVKYIKTTGDVKLYTPIVSDVVGLVRFQGGILNSYGGNGYIRVLDNFQLGPNLVRGFEPLGIGPRDLTVGTTNDALGGTKYWGASVELQMPFWFLPKEVGLKGAVFADAGSLWGYEAETSYLGQTVQPGDSLSMHVRSSVGVGLIWASPFGPLRFDYAVPLSKQPYDRVQEFRFGGGTSF